MAKEIKVHFPKNNKTAPQAFFVSGRAVAGAETEIIKSIHWKVISAGGGAMPVEIGSRIVKTKPKDKKDLRYRWRILLADFTPTKTYKLEFRWVSNVGTVTPVPVTFTIKEEKRLRAGRTVDPIFPSNTEYTVDEAMSITAYGTVAEDCEIRAVRMNDIPANNVEQFGTFWTACFPALGVGTYTLNAQDSEFHAGSEGGIVVKQPTE